VHAARGLPAAGVLRVTEAALFLAITLAQLVETITGFGGTVLALSLGAQLVPLPPLVTALVAIGWLQSAWLVARGFREIRWRTLGLVILPLTAPGLALGALFAARADEALLRRALGLFVVLAAALELHRLVRGAGQAKLPWPLTAALLLGGGAVHGVLGSGGPLVVTWLSRAVPEKAAFRATVSALWLLLNTVLLVAFALAPREPAAVTQYFLLGLPALAVGVALGELVQRRVPERTFRFVAQGVLLTTGVLLLVPR